MKKVYLDYNATTPVRREVVDAMVPYFREIFGNASSVHFFGQQAKKVLEDSREKVAAFIGAKDTAEIVFTSCGTESNNFAIKGVAWANKDKGNHIITSAIEHHAVLAVCQYLQKEGFNVTYIGVDRTGRIDPQELNKAITDKTILVTIMHANNETGTIQPIEKIGEIINRQSSIVNHKIYFHTDAIQTVGKIPVKVENLGVDLLSISAHKFYGPKGVGCLYIKKGTKMHQLLHGGTHERKRRAGTENIPYIVGLAKAIELVQMNMSVENERISELRDKLKKGIFEKVEYVHFNGHPTECLSNTLNISFEFVEGEGLILALDLEGIAVSTGSACTSGSLEKSHVLTAMGVPPEISQGSMRFSLGHENTEEDIDYVLDILPKIVNRFRAMSPLWEDKIKGIKREYSDKDNHHKHEEE